MKICYLSLNRRTGTWNLSVLSNKETGTKTNYVIYTSVSELIITKNRSKCSEKI